jgi:tetratricopeptide (TPR) repeat protein
MEAMVREQTIPLRSDDYRDAKNNFQENLKDIINITKNHKKPIIISTLTSNLRDQKPLLSIFLPNTNDGDRRKWQNLMDEGSKLMNAGKYDLALSMFNNARQIDSGNADGFFRTANCCDSMGKYNEAYDLYSLARDYDAMRFRATKEFNELIRATAQETNIQIADAECAFEDASPHRLVGNNLMLEHLHPNFEGYFLLAKIFFETLHKNNVIVNSTEWASSQPVNDAEMKRLSGVTDLTIESANIRIHSLVNRWPFKPAGVKSPDYVPVTQIQKIALDYVTKKIPWSSAHMNLAEWYKSRNEYEKARNEYYAISKVAWYSYQPYMNMGDMERLLNHPFTAESLYKRAIEIEANPFIHVRLGMLYYDMDSLQKSIFEFEEGFRSELSAKEQFKPSDRSMARYFLAVAYGKSGNVARAKDNIDIALRIDPNNEEARKLLLKIK